MPAHYQALYDVRNCYGQANRPKRYVWGVYLRSAPTNILHWAKTKREAAHIAAQLSSPLKRLSS